MRRRVRGCRARTFLDQTCRADMAAGAAGTAAAVAVAVNADTDCPRLETPKPSVARSGGTEKAGDHLHSGSHDGEKPQGGHRQLRQQVMQREVAYHLVAVCRVESVAFLCCCREALLAGHIFAVLTAIICPARNRKKACRVKPRSVRPRCARVVQRVAYLKDQYF